MTHPSESSKDGIRAAMKETLASMSPEDRHTASEAACSRLLNLDAFRHASMVMLYMPLAHEVDTMPLALWAFQLGKAVCVPRVDWGRRDMNAVEISSFDDHTMETDDHGIRTPRSARLVVPEAIDLVVVPGLAFDANGSRLGRGGGFYDRFLSRLRRTAVTIGFTFDQQIIDHVPIDERDVHVDLVVTDRRVTRTRSRSRR